MKLGILVAVKTASTMRPSTGTIPVSFGSVPPSLSSHTEIALETPTSHMRKLRVPTSQHTHTGNLTSEVHYRADENASNTDARRSSHPGLVCMRLRLVNHLTMLKPDNSNTTAQCQSSRRCQRHIAHSALFLLLSARATPATSKDRLPRDEHSRVSV